LLFALSRSIGICGMDESHPFSGLAATTGLSELTGIISRAGCAILALDRSKVAWRAKPDHSPVSAADEAANAIIVQGLSRLLPGVPIVSEEDHNKPLALGASFVLVDPLDGTREFLAGRDEFTVNVALISRGRPIIGLIAAPALGFVWRGMVGRGAERLRLAAGAAPQETTEISSLRARDRPTDGFVAMTSRSHFDAKTDAFLKRLPVIAQIPCGSSVKFARIAEGSADLYARLGRTCEWDVAAGHAILTAAGGLLTTLDGGELVYGGAPDFYVPGFIAWGDASAAAQLLKHGCAQACARARPGSGQATIT
jgi:3'(2'), 5'-bisphosphate nucleotidase